MLDIKQATQNMFMQIEIYGQSGKLIDYSLGVRQDAHGQLVLFFKNPNGMYQPHNLVIIPFNITTLRGQVKRTSDLDMLKALKEIGNAHIRFLNSRRADQIDRHELVDNGHESPVKCEYPTCLNAAVETIKGINVCPKHFEYPIR